MSTDASLDYARGVLHGVQKSTWTCGDCGNTYDPTVQHCPNVTLDHAHVNLRLAESLAGNAAEAPGKSPASDTTPAEASIQGNDDSAEKHDPKCVCAKGSCCSWISDCTCQCMCDIIAEIRADERATMAHPTLEVDTRVRSTYLRLSNSPVARTTQATPRVLVDLDGNGDLVGIELIGITP